MYKLEKGDILITKFTDTAWKAKLSIISGIVTACGGVLCHLAIILRKYNIPALLE